MTDQLDVFLWDEQELYHRDFMAAIPDDDYSDYTGTVIVQKPGALVWQGDEGDCYKP